MKNSKNIDMRFWQNDFVLGLSPEERYFYMYLITNTMTTQCGIYKFNRKLAGLETGYTVDQIVRLLEKFQEYGKIIISQSSKEIMLVNWFKHNFKNNKRTKAAINNELQDVKDKDFVKQLYQICLERQIPVEELFGGVLLPRPQKAKEEKVVKEGSVAKEKEEKTAKESFTAKAQEEKKVEEASAVDEEAMEEILLKEEVQLTEKKEEASMELIEKVCRDEGLPLHNEKVSGELVCSIEGPTAHNNSKVETKTAAALESKPISFEDCQRSDKVTSRSAGRKKTKTKRSRKKQKQLLQGEGGDFLFGCHELQEEEIVEDNYAEEVELTEDLTDVDLASLEGWEVVQCWNLQ